MGELNAMDRSARRRQWIVAALLANMWLVSIAGGQNSVGRWWKPYSGEDAEGPRVLGFWRFDSAGEGLATDTSSYAHQAVAAGATWSADGRYGGCMEGGAGFPVHDTGHAIHVRHSATLSPARAFSAEMWIRPKDADEFLDTLSPVLFDSKYVFYEHQGMMWSLTRAVGQRRRMALELGLGDHSDTWYSHPVRLVPKKWHHVAFTYDAKGTVTFFFDGAVVGQVHHEKAGPMEPAKRPLSIGDRLGANYRGFPGWIDEVRIVAGAIDYRPVRLTFAHDRLVIRRQPSGASRFRLDIDNQTGEKIGAVQVEWRFSEGPRRELGPVKFHGPRASLDVPVPRNLKPGNYRAVAAVVLPRWLDGTTDLRIEQEVAAIIKPRPLPHQLPVVMWGIGGTDTVVKEIPRLKEIGFTHCLGIGVDYEKIWAMSQPGGRKPGRSEYARIASNDERTVRMLQEADAHDIGIIASLSPGGWLRRAAAGRPFLRVDRDGKPYQRADICGLFPEVREFCYNTGAVLGSRFGQYPAFRGALLHTEVRDASEVSFHPIERAAFRKATGLEIPSVVRRKRGVDYRKLRGFPKDRVIADDDPILVYYRWFWQEGDGWNELNTQLHQGLKDSIGRRSFWTFHDPAVRVPSTRGSGGDADVLSHWTYSYPDPIRIGLCTDELFEMAHVNGDRQRVMKMTQIIWYRSQTAPIGTPGGTTTTPWVDRDPDAAYITIAPMHLREAFWWKIARPIHGIMYHGWQSLVPTESTSAYRLTNRNTKDELKRLIANVVRPLGPTLMQVPDAPSDVAFLESFTSQMFAGRGTYGWNHTWAGDVYHMLMYAHLQPRVMYEESILSGELSGIRLLVMPDCDVLPKSVVDAIRAFQKKGGLVIGDKELCPAIEPNYVVERFSRTKDAREDKQRLVTAAASLGKWLEGRYEPAFDSTNPDVVVRRRRFMTTDYLFAVNDRRTYGTYVGQFGLVMEDGLPATATLHLRRCKGYVYDLLRHRPVRSTDESGRLSFPCRLGPCEGRVWMVTERPIQAVEVKAPSNAKLGQSIAVEIAVTDGEQPIDAVVPVDVRITDPEGVAGEFSGYYGAAAGRLTVPIDFAPNDRLGVWKIHVRELASGREATAYVTLGE